MFTEPGELHLDQSHRLFEEVCQAGRGLVARARYEGVPTTTFRIQEIRRL